MDYRAGILVFLFHFYSLFSWAESVLDPELKKLLVEAESGGYFSVRVLERNRGARPQRVILLGEFHLKSEKASALGKQILERSNQVGVEGIFTEKYLGGYVIFHLQRVIGWVSDKASGGRYGQTSTVADAVNKNGLKIHYLEKDHEPSVGEQTLFLSMDALLSTVMLKWGVEFACSKTYAMLTGRPEPVQSVPLYRLHTSLKWLLRGFILTGGSSFVWGMYDESGLIEGRNESMVQVAESAVKQDDPTLLVIVGAAHMQGMSRQLQSK